MRAAIYSRKSKFTGKGESIENQVLLCRSYAYEQLHIAAEDIEVYEDEGFSGGTMDRPRFARLLADASARRFDVLICYRLDRISRNVADFSALMARLERLGIGFVSVRERFDTTNPMGRAMLYISSVFAQLERETIAERVRDNMLQLSRTGRWLGGRAPMGYASERVSHADGAGKQRSHCRLVVVAREADAVRRLFEAYVELGNVSRLVSHCRQHGITNARGAAFTAHTLLFLLHNPVYCRATPQVYDYLRDRVGELCDPREAYDGAHGLMPYNRTRQGDDARARRAMGEWIIAVGEHEGIVEGDLWIRVQERMRANTSRGFRAPRRIDALLSGVLRCGACGAAMRPRGENKCNPPKHYYGCEAKTASHGADCRMRNVDGTRLDALLRDALDAYASPMPDVRAALRGHMGELMEDLAGHAGRASRLLRERDALAREEERLVDAIALSPSEDATAVLMRHIERKEARRMRIEAELEGARGGAGETPCDEEAMLALLQRAAEASQAISNGELREILRAAGVVVRWTGERAIVELSDAGDGREAAP